MFKLADGSTFEVFPNSQVSFRANRGDWKDLLDADEVFSTGNYSKVMSVTTIEQRTLLEEGLELLSAEVRARHRLGGASSVQYALGSLLREDFISREIDRYVVVDSLLREWVARRTLPARTREAM